ncbi:Crp/Fnr family transcriptional regulator [Candidatus Latescibacterota bacterium]
MEKESRREGSDRRGQDLDKPDDNRSNPERRGLIKDPGRTIEVMKKIPIFQGLTEDDYKKLIRICAKKSIPKEEVLCKKGDESVELFILLKGQLKVMLSSSTFLTYINPIGLVGEIGIFTGAKRSATVLTSVDCTVIRIHKKEILDLFRSNAILSTRVLLNVIADISSKLQEDNDLIEELRNKKRTRIL